jgi:hypothetical protein
MIRSFISLSILFSATAYAATNTPPAWPKNFSKDLKDKTFHQAFCEKSPGFQTKALCNYMQKNSLNEKLISVSVQGETLTLQDGSRTVEIKRTKNELQFEINRKIIDLAILREPAQLLAALNKALPKVANNSLWMNSAHAQEETEHFSVMTNASAFILSATVDQGLCAKAKDFVIACTKNIEGFSGTTQFNISIDKYRAGKIKTSDDMYLRWIISNTQEMIVLLYKMQELVNGLSTPEVRQSLRQCPSIVDDTHTGESDMDACGEILATRKTVIRKMYDDAGKFKSQLEEQEKLANQLENIAGTNKSAPSKSSAPASKPSSKKDAIR